MSSAHPSRAPVAPIRSRAEYGDERHVITKNIVVVGGSAGGLEALLTLVASLPKDFPGSIFAVLHTAPDSPGLLADILGRAATLRTALVTRRMTIEPGVVYVAPPDYHIVLEPGVVRPTRGPKENRFRPALDPLFRSAAQVYGPAAVGVVLSGGLDDGTAGLWTIKQLGGTAIVQDPDDAMYPSMPQHALDGVRVDFSVPADELAPLLVRLAATPADAHGAIEMGDNIDIEVNIAKADRALDAGVLRLGSPSSFACPECHGVLLRVAEGGRVRFRCHTGHAYSSDSLLSAVEEAVDEALWNAIRALDERAMFAAHVAAHMTETGRETDAARMDEVANDSRRRASLVRQATLKVADAADVAEVETGL
jgi:two-component system chemotaxis response regulator CheB